MTTKIYLRPAVIEYNKAKLDILLDDAEIDEEEDLEVKSIYEPVNESDNV